MIVAITIIAVAAGVLMPVFNSIRLKMRLNGAVGQVQGDFMRARMQAISKNNEFRVFFVDDHTYEILDDDGAGGGTANDGIQNGDETVVTKYFRNDNNPDDRPPYFDIVFDLFPPLPQNPIFAPNGALDWPIGFSVTLRNSTTLEAKQILISSAGRIRVQKVP